MVKIKPIIKGVEIRWACSCDEIATEDTTKLEKQFYTGGKKCLLVELNCKKCGKKYGLKLYAAKLINSTRGKKASNPEDIAKLDEFKEEKKE